MARVHSVVCKHTADHSQILYHLFDEMPIIQPPTPNHLLTPGRGPGQVTSTWVRDKHVVYLYLLPSGAPIAVRGSRLGDHISLYIRAGRSKPWSVWGSVWRAEANHGLFGAV